MSAGRRGAAAVVLAASTSAACLPTAATAQGRDVAALYQGFMVVAVIIGALVVVLTTWAVVRYRRRGDALPPQTHGDLRLELVWTVLPAITIGVLFAATILVLGRVDARQEPATTEVAVSAFRWGWEFSYPGEDVTVSGIGVPGPEVVVPAGEPVRFILTAADVNHALFVPEFLVKRDMYPGRENVIEVTIDEPGTYEGQCAEFCGIYHSKMPFVVRAVPRQEYDAWLAERRNTGDTPVPIGSPVATDPAERSTASPPAQSPGAP